MGTDQYNIDQIDQDDEIDIYELWLVITKHKKFIWIFITTITTVATIATLFMTNYYQSKTIILPISQKNTALTSLSNISNIASLVGISIPLSSTNTEIMALLNSDSLKAEIIKKYNLLPILFYNSWDSKHKCWKKKNLLLKKIIYDIKWSILSLVKKRNYKPKLHYYPTLNDGIKKLSKLITVNNDNKLGTISIEVYYTNPYIAKNICLDILTTLKQHLRNETINLAEKNKILLEKELTKTSDPIIQQKIYELIAKQIETIVTASINENFAFKIIDPPRVSEKIFKPNRLLIISVTFISSIFLSLFLIFFKEYVSNINRGYVEKKVDVEKKQLKN